MRAAPEALQSQLPEAGPRSFPCSGLASHGATIRRRLVRGLEPEQCSLT